MQNATQELKDNVFFPQLIDEEQEISDKGFYRDREDFMRVRVSLDIMGEDQYRITRETQMDGDPYDARSIRLTFQEIEEIYNKVKASIG